MGTEGGIEQRKELDHDQDAGICRIDHLQAEPGTEVLVPLVVAGYYLQCSILSVQDTDSTSRAEATIEIYQVGDAEPALA